MPVLAESRTEKEYQDCLACKLTGAGAFSGLGGYALYEANKLNKVPGKLRTAVGLGVAGVLFVSAGIYRLLL
ncbi:hypothetical protein VTP01DRAFT_4580 [Rhizomucor pusillus]|uniref:uncharacterized protein n=1 Tax=Rhizomucor pusillus TaxID=4840 RepID=UPI003744A760